MAAPVFPISPLLPAIRRAASSRPALIICGLRSGASPTWMPHGPFGSVPAGPIASSMPWSMIVGIVWSRLCAYARISTRCSAHFSAITITDR